LIGAGAHRERERTTEGAEAPDTERPPHHRKARPTQAASARGSMSAEGTARRAMKERRAPATAAARSTISSRHTDEAASGRRLTACRSSDTTQTATVAMTRTKNTPRPDPATIVTTLKLERRTTWRQRRSHGAAAPQLTGE
jgi:hypothetical protein